MFNTAAEAQAAFTALSNEAQHAAWEKFTVDIDEGMAGWNPYYLYLNSLYWDGSSPFPDEDAAAEAEYRADALEMLNDIDHWNDACILAQDASEDAFWDRFTPEAADAIMGCPA
ncbi:hypothetical protein [Brevundimonas naejangsanensis]|uniref:hypothetical protein n=1 Tax=Brevundimonas naejangsanensis TaxID=588932 RepID=UPI0026EA1323|nr:hypothetical protein [Brevundimonas naejangsanensis]